MAKPTSLSDTFKDYQQTLFSRQKYIKNEFQAYGLELAKELHDWSHRTLYLRFAKTMDRKILEQARYFVKDQLPHTIKSPAKLFMWKLKEIRLNKATPSPIIKPA